MTTTPTSGAADLPESLRASHGQAPYPAAAPAQSCDCSQGQVCQVCDPVLPVQEAEREAFEAWFSVKLLPMGHEHPFMQRNSRGEYNRGDTAARWEAWQARAVLAKGGTPAGAGEPFGYFHQLLNHEGKGNGVWLGAAERKVVEQAHTPGETSEEIVTLYTTPQPTHAQADSVQEDAALWHWLAEYLVGTRTDLDDELVACETVNDLRKLVKAAMNKGATK